MRRLALAAALVVALSGCAIVRTLQRGVNVMYDGGATTQADLRDRLFGYGSSFDVFVGEAADRISSGTSEPRVRRLTLLWKIRMPDAATLAVSNPDPREAYVESLTLAIAQRQFFEEGGGKEMFGAQQPIAVEAARQIESRAVAIGETFLKPAQLEDLSARLETLARENPIRGEFRREGIQAGLQKAETGGMFTDIVSLPMAPFRALEGVDTGAQAIREFNVTAQRATDIVADLPQRIRWQIELLTYDLQEQGGALDRALGAFDTLAQSSDRLSLAAETLPEETRATLEATAAELEQQSASLQKLLAEYRASVTETNAALASAAPLVDALAKTAEQVNQAGVAWSSLVARLKAPGAPPEPGAPPRRPFDILDYEKTAQSITQTASELRLLLDQVQAQQASLGSALLRQVVIAGLILIVAFFATLLVYRILAARLAR